jgi:hypothetical protein
MVTLNIGRVFLSFNNKFTKKDKGPREGNIVRNSPFLPNFKVCLPSMFGFSAFEEAMLW